MHCTYCVASINYILYTVYFLSFSSMAHTIIVLLSSSSPSSYSLSYVGSMYDGICLQVARSYKSSADSPFSLMSSFTLSNHLLLGLPSPLYFHFRRHPSYVVFLSSHHMPIPLQPPFLYFLCDFPTFVVPLSLSFDILSIFVSLHIHRSILISATSIFFLCLLQRPCLCPVHQCWYYHCMYTFLLIYTFIFLSHNTRDTLFQFFQPLCTLLVTSPSSANVVIVIAPKLFSLLSTNLQSSLFHCSSLFIKLPFYMLSSSTA